MEWYEVNDPSVDSLDDRRVATVLAMKDSRIEELKTEVAMAERHIIAAERDRLRMQRWLHLALITGALSSTVLPWLVEVLF